MAEYVNYLRVFGAPGAARALFGAIQDDTAGLGSVDLNRITPMPVWMREEPLSAGTVRRQGGENCWLDWRQANWGTRWNTLKAQASAAASVPAKAFCKRCADWRGERVKRETFQRRQTDGQSGRESLDHK